MPAIWSLGWRLVYDPAAPVSAGSLSRLGHGRRARQFFDPAKLNLPNTRRTLQLLSLSAQHCKQSWDSL